jgi:sugar phosphate isomerase/epimerase
MNTDHGERPSADSAPCWPLGASTLGTPDDPLDVVLGWLRAADAEFLELRVGPGQPVDIASTAGRRTEVRDQIAAAGVQLLSVASYVRTGDNLDDEAVIGDCRAHLQLAADLGATYLRVFPGAPIREVPFDRVPPLIEDPAVVDARIVRRLAAVAADATDLGVRPVLETHDSHPRGQDIARVLIALDGAAPGHPVGAIWDVLHPFRVGEDPERTAELLAPYLTAGRGYVQIKDVASRTVLTPVDPGVGIAPLPEIFDRLRATGYRGPVSLEWERVWHPGIEALPRPLAVAADWLNRHRPD